MPITPDVARPIGRSVSSSALNRIDMALRLTKSRSSSAEMSAASMSFVFTQVDGDDATCPVRVEISEFALLHQARPGRQHQIRRDRVVTDRDDVRYGFVGLEGQQVG